MRDAFIGRLDTQTSWFDEITTTMVEPFGVSDDLVMGGEQGEDENNGDENEEDDSD